jgi:hypothetical protein
MKASEYTLRNVYVVMVSPPFTSASVIGVFVNEEAARKLADEVGGYAVMRTLDWAGEDA